MSIVVEKLNYTYMAGTHMAYNALTDINFEIKEGEFLGIMGHTGSGKSTLVQHLNGLLLPSSGRVVVDGLDLNDKAQRQKGRELVGMVFQYAEYQLFEETVAKDIAFGPRNQKLSEEEIDQRVHEAMELVGLDYSVFAEKSPFDLSGGEKRRAALAGIIAMRPRYLVLDEPMAGLDPGGRRQIMELLSHLRKQTGCTLIMVSHSMDDVAKYADRILVLEHGKVAMLDCPERIFEQPDRLEEIGLALPQAAQLLVALKRRGVDVPKGIFRTIDVYHWLEEVLPGHE